MPKVQLSHAAEFLAGLLGMLHDSALRSASANSRAQIWKRSVNNLNFTLTGANWIIGRPVDMGVRPFVPGTHAQTILLSRRNILH